MLRASSVNIFTLVQEANALCKGGHSLSGKSALHQEIQALAYARTPTGFQGTQLCFAGVVT